MSARTALLWVGLFAAAAGCDGDTTMDPAAAAAPDAALDIDADVTGPDGGVGCPAEVDAPVLPQGLPCAAGACDGHGPDLGDDPCPPGWRADRVPEARGTICWPPALAVCDHPDAFGGCAPACSDEVPTDALHVAPGDAPGDGTVDRPFTDLAAALGAATPGDVIFLHPGRYGGPVEVPADVTLRGACAASVEIVGPADGKAVTLSAGAVLSAVTVRDADDGIARPADGGAIARVEGVRVVDVRRGIVVAGGLQLRGSVVLGDGAVGVYVIDGALDAEDLVVRGATDAVVVRGGRAALSDALLVDLARVGVGAAVGAQVILRRVGVSTVGRGAPDALSVGVQATEPGTAVELDRVAVLSARGSGLLVNTEAHLDGGNLLLADIGDGRADARGVSAARGAQVSLEGIAVLGVRGGAIASAGAGAVMTVRRAVVTDVGRFAPLGDVIQGHAVSAHSGGALDVTDLRVARQDGAAIGVYDGAAVTLRDAVLGPAAVDALYGGGIVGQGASAIDAERVVIEGTAAAAVWLEDTARVHLRDVRVFDVRPDRTRGTFGVGLGLVRVPDAQLERVHVERARLFGVESLASTVRASDLLVTDTQEGSEPRSQTPDEDAQGMGLAVAGGTFEVDRLTVRDSHVTGVWLAWTAEGPTHFTGRQVRVTGTRPGACRRVTCLDLGGHGFLIEREADTLLEGVVVDDNSGVGLWRQCDDTLALRDARVSGSAVGVAALPACDPLAGIERTCLGDNDEPFGAGSAITPPAAPGGGPGLP